MCYDKFGHPSRLYGPLTALDNNGACDDNHDACDNDAGIYFEDNEVRRVVTSRQGAKVSYVSVSNGEVNERPLEAEMIE